MLGGIAGQGGFDSKGKTSNIGYGATSSQTYVDALNITGSGYVVGVTLTGQEYPFIKIVIDGVTKIDANPVTVSYGGDSTAIPLMFRFESSLQVQIKLGTSAGWVRAITSYLLD